MATTKLLPEHIVSEQPVVHPALDWRDGVLLMGVTLAEGERGVLTSRGEMLRLDQLPFPSCERGRNFGRSPVTERVARQFQGSKGSREVANALVVTDLAAYYRRFVIFPDPWWPEVLALWTLGTYVYPIFSSYPYVRISSPEPGCGKSLLGEIISKLSFNGELMVSPTEANIFRLAESERGTQIWDEVENQNAIDQSRLHSMNAALLNGYRAGGAVPRQEKVGKNFETIRFHVYVPRVLIGLSDLPPVVQQRTIALNLQRRSSGDTVERYRAEKFALEEQHLREECTLWALTYCGSTAHQYDRKELVTHLEEELGQAGRLVDDLLLPLASVAAAPAGEQRARHVLLPMLQQLIKEVFPAISQSWSETASTTPAWFSAALDLLDGGRELEPAELARSISDRGFSISAERISRELKKYKIRSTKDGGRRVISVPPAQIAQLRKQYGIVRREPEPVEDVEARLAPLAGQ